MSIAHLQSLSRPLYKIHFNQQKEPFQKWRPPLRAPYGAIEPWMTLASVIITKQSQLGPTTLLPQDIKRHHNLHQGLRVNLDIHS